MIPSPCPDQDTSFFQLLSQTTTLDGRDNRGKRHTIALVISGLILALCCGRDGNLSSLHRHMIHHFKALCQALQLTNQTVISRAQLPRLLAKVNGVLLAELLFQRFGIRLTSQQQAWFAADGKELRGSIVSGNKRGEACVSLVSQTLEKFPSQYLEISAMEQEATLLEKGLLREGLWEPHQKMVAVIGA